MHSATWRSSERSSSTSIAGLRELASVTSSAILVFSPLESQVVKWKIRLCKAAQDELDLRILQPSYMSTPTFSSHLCSNITISSRKFPLLVICRHHITTQKNQIKSPKSNGGQMPRKRKVAHAEDGTVATAAKKSNAPPPPLDEGNEMERQLSAHAASAYNDFVRFFQRRASVRPFVWEQLDHLAVCCPANDACALPLALGQLRRSKSRRTACLSSRTSSSRPRAGARTRWRPRCPTTARCSTSATSRVRPFPSNSTGGANLRANDGIHVQ